MIYIKFWDLWSFNWSSNIQIKEEMARIIENCGITLCGKDFSPHMTLMKLSKFKQARKKGSQVLQQKKEAFYLILIKRCLNFERYQKDRPVDLWASDGDWFWHRAGRFVTFVQHSRKERNRRILQDWKNTRDF
jgi:hypothetical protein